MGKAQVDRSGAKQRRQTRQRWRVKPTVFMPSLPALFEQDQLDRVLVGLADGEGNYTGLGYLEFAPEDGILRLISPSTPSVNSLVRKTGRGFSLRVL